MDVEKTAPRIVLAMFTTTPGAVWLPLYQPPHSIAQQIINDRLTLVIDPPPSTLSLCSPQVYSQKSLCVEKLATGICTKAPCPHEHKTGAEVVTEIESQLRRPVPTSDLEPVENRPLVPTATAEDLKKWLERRPRLWLGMLQKTRQTYWLRRFEDVAENRNWDPTWQLTPLHSIAVVVNPTLVDLRRAEPIQLYSKQLCIFYVQNAKCERPGCNFLHRSEGDIRLAVGKRHFEVKALPKEQRVMQVVTFSPLGVPMMLTPTAILRNLIEEKERRKGDRARKGKAPETDSSSANDSSSDVSTSTDSSDDRRRKKKKKAKKAKKKEKRRRASKSRSPLRRERTPPSRGGRGGDRGRDDRGRDDRGRDDRGTRGRDRDRGDGPRKHSRERSRSRSWE